MLPALLGLDTPWVLSAPGVHASGVRNAAVWNVSGSLRQALASGDLLNGHAAIFRHKFLGIRERLLLEASGLLALTRFLAVVFQDLDSEFMDPARDTVVSSLYKTFGGSSDKVPIPSPSPPHLSPNLPPPRLASGIV